MNATIINFWRNKAGAHLAVAVNEGGAIGNVEYIGTVDGDTFSAFDPSAEKKAALVQACKDVRDDQMQTDAPLAGMTGQVAL